MIKLTVVQPHHDWIKFKQAFVFLHRNKLIEQWISFAEKFLYISSFWISNEVGANFLLMLSSCSPDNGCFPIVISILPRRYYLFLFPDKSYFLLRKDFCNFQTTALFISLQTTVFHFPQTTALCFLIFPIQNCFYIFS